MTSIMCHTWIGRFNWVRKNPEAVSDSNQRKSQQSKNVVVLNGEDHTEKYDEYTE